MDGAATNRVIFLVLRRMRAPLIVLILSYGISILGFVLIPGGTEEGGRWRMDFFHAFYFVSYTASTIGFGELPAEFSPAQRMWTVVSIYITVVSWVYALGKMLTLVQDEAIRGEMHSNAFLRSVRRLAEPFVIVCGYGDVGRLLVHALPSRGIRPIVIDSDPPQIDELSLEEPGVFIPNLLADARRSDVLIAAGMQRGGCRGVVALTGSDPVNLKVAINVKLLNPRLTVICRADRSDTEENMASFGTDYIVNAFEVFANRLALALHSPRQYLVHEWLTSVPDSPLEVPLAPPHGRWILCGYGRFGKAVYRRLLDEGVEVTVIEETPDRVGCAAFCIKGRGTEAVTLNAAGVDTAAGIVAGTDDDTNNLSIVMTARALNPALFLVARQNEEENATLFDTAGLDLIMHRSEVIARQIFVLLTNPLLLRFLEEMRRAEEPLAHELIHRIREVAGDAAPEVRTIEISEQGSPAVVEALAKGEPIACGSLVRDPLAPENELKSLILARIRDNVFRPMPWPHRSLHAGDRLLFCGRPSALSQMEWNLNNPNVLRRSSNALGGGTQGEGG